MNFYAATPEPAKAGCPGKESTNTGQNEKQPGMLPAGAPQERKTKVIDYQPFWKTLKKSGESTYTLITRHRISSATVDRLRKNKPMNTTTLNDLCRVLECTLEDVARYVPDESGGKKEV